MLTRELFIFYTKNYHHDFDIEAFVDKGLSSRMILLGLIVLSGGQLLHPLLVVRRIVFLNPPAHLCEALTVLLDGVLTNSMQLCFFNSDGVCSFYVQACPNDGGIIGLAIDGVMPASLLDWCHGGIS